MSKAQAITGKRRNAKTAVNYAAFASFCFGLAGAPAIAQRTGSADSGVLTPSRRAVDSSAPVGSSPGRSVDLRTGDRSTGPNSNAGAEPGGSLGPLVEAGECGDILSNALQQDGGGTPCWADIRTVDHWNTMRLANGPTVQGGPGFLPVENETPAGFSFAVGGLGGPLLTRQDTSSAYAGAGALSGFIQRRRWELMYEDGGALGNYQLHGSNLVGLNRAALRANGQLTSRWLWQGSATNAYGTDKMRLFAPLDYRTVGASEAPVAETVAYGLHAGTLVDQQEDFKVRSAESRRSNWDFALAHTLRHYSDDGVNVQTVRGRADYVYATSRNSALGLLVGASDQTGPASCTLGGAGLLGLMQWGTRASFSISGSANGASHDCGKRVQFTGDASFYLRAGDRDDLFLTGNRDLSGGVVENLALLDSAGGGIRHQFTRDVSLRLSGSAIYGVDPKTKIDYNGTFAEASMSFPLGAGFLQEASYRHYQVSKVPGGDNRNLATFTLWWSPKKNRQTLQARH